MRRTYYRIELETLSALSIGAADSIETDHDVVLDGRGLPLIPATSLRGVLRSRFAHDESLESALFALFGNIDKVAGTTHAGAVRVYDATHIGGNKAVSVRDSVKLKDEDKVADPKHKFDRQIVEKGARFLTYIELTDACQADDLDFADAETHIEGAIAALNAGVLLLGSKTTRGMGKVEVSKCQKRAFSFAQGDLKDESDTGQLGAWLAFDMFDDACWEDDDKGFELPPAPAESGITIHLELDLVGALSIREYTATPGEADFSQLAIREELVEPKREGGDEGKAVIPGTSWAGAFRHRYRDFAGDPKTRGLFGTVDEESGEIARSAITFSESVVEGGSSKLTTRNAIDRFTGGTVDGALFTSENHYGGHTSLDMRIKADHEDDLGPLLAAILDLHHGLLAVGGMTSVGNGRFRIAEDGTYLERNGARLDDFLVRLGISENESGERFIDIAGCVEEVKKLGAQEVAHE